MAEVQTVPSTPSQPRDIQTPSRAVRVAPPASAYLALPSSAPPSAQRNQNRNTQLVVQNSNGSFPFDRIVKSGYVNKRTRKTKAWKSIYIVLRPNMLSIYKDDHEEKLRHKIMLSELTAVAKLKDPKHKREGVFGLFSPSRNYHFQAQSTKDSQEWVDLIMREARIDEEEEGMMLASPEGNMSGEYARFESAIRNRTANMKLHEDRVGASSPEPHEASPLAKRNPRVGPRRRASQTLDYSGNELGSLSDHSDADPYRPRGRISADKQNKGTSTTTKNISATAAIRSAAASEPNAEGVSRARATTEAEQILWQGYVLYLKSKSGVRQWKPVWVVLRRRHFAVYPNEQEYAPLLIIPADAIINAAEINPLSRSKQWCFQVITEEKTYKFCAKAEEGLWHVLGAFKCLLAKMKEGRAKPSSK